MVCRILIGDLSYAIEGRSFPLPLLGSECTLSIREMTPCIGDWFKAYTVSWASALTSLGY